MNILITGGTGYIGSHTIVELLKDKENNIISIDNFSNSSSIVNNNIFRIAKRRHIFFECDLLNIKEIDKIFSENKIDIVIHFAGLKSVNESVTNPIKYYKNNVIGTLNLLDVMNKYNVKNIIFSSSATVYGNPIELPINELAHLNTTNPYGRNKLHIENMLEDLIYSDKNWSVTILRYFNPIGAHESGFLGENPNGVPNNIMPFITQVAAGSIERLNIFGKDYDTKDGTGVRDYIHVVDLANGHKKAVNKTMYSTGLNIYNLGTGKGYSVLELINAFEKVNNIKINYVFTERRSGDVAACFANPTRANNELKWKAKKSIEDMVRDSWNYQKISSLNKKKQI